MPPNSRQNLASPIVNTKPSAIVNLHPEMNIPRENLKSSATAVSRESEIVVEIEESVSASGESTMESRPSDAGVAASGSSGSGKVPERRTSSEMKQKLHGNQLMSSLQTVVRGLLTLYTAALCSPDLIFLKFGSRDVRN